MLLRRLIPSLALLLPAAATLRADEGMWLTNQLPREQLKQRYNFDVTDAWMDHVRLSAVRFNSGGSGSFVSADGLVITNHHVGADAIGKLSTKERDLIENGFFARTMAEEKKASDLELNMLESIEDVTARVNAAVPAETAGDAEASFKARRKAIADIEKESQDKTGLRSNVITLWQGGAYHLYRFKRFTDVRLVFAPEKAVAAFGGDPDNFEYPRYDLDFSLFRVYENGQPYHPKDFLKWSANGSAEGDLTFVLGNPGTTRRLLTVAELRFVRDVQFPRQLARVKRLEATLLSWAARDAENARRAKDPLAGIQNGRKVRDGAIAALYDPQFFAVKEKAEADFKAKLSASPEKFAAALAAYDKIAEAQKALAAADAPIRQLEGGQAFYSESYSLARRLLRAAAERPKPNGERLPEYSDSNKGPFELGLFSDEPIYTDLEIQKLSFALQDFAEEMGADSEIVKKVLAGKSPRARAAELINGTKVRDLAVRKQLYEGGQAAVDAAKDPMIELARLVDDEARAARRIADSQGEVKKQGQAALAAARNAVEGQGGYPDATFSLRLSYGTVKGYTEDGKPVPAFTDVAGMFARSEAQKGREPFNVPPSWTKARAKIGPKTPFNLVSTHDIIGGNSGSPMVNRAGEFVGIIFDGNLQSLSGDFAYDDRESRALSVDSRVIVESLDKVYGAARLARELRDGKMPAK